MPLGGQKIGQGLDLLALLGIIQGLWGIDIAVFAPQILFEWVHWGTYLGLMYIQIGAAGVWLYIRASPPGSQRAGWT